MVVLPYFGPWENSHFQFPLNLTSTNTKVEHMLKANDIWKSLYNTGVIHVIEISTELPCSSSSSSSSSASSSG